MKTTKYPDKAALKSLLARPRIDTASLNATVCRILDDVRQNGDNAVRHYEKLFDKAELASLRVSEQEMERAESLVSDELKRALRQAHANIAAFHSAQMPKGCRVETAPGVVCWQKAIPIQKVGLYIPGGTAPLFSTVLMLATPAKIAGCPQITLCTPPGKDGNVNPAILVAASIAGVHNIYKVGGVQAIGGMAYGTETIPKAHKIFGPGNQYVMAAKQQVGLHDVAIDMPAGPSEVCVIADASSNPEYVAADLLSQAEHGTDSQVLLISTSEATAEKVEQEIARQLPLLPRKGIAEKALDNSNIIIADNGDDAMDIANAYAPEHLIIATADCERLAGKVINAGSVFVGVNACESAGDYASGTNHTLPTHGYAVAYSGVNIDSFMRKVTFQHISDEGLQSIGHAVEVMAESEELFAHKNAMTVRLNHLIRQE